MLRSVRRLVAMLTVLGLVLGFWLPPEHIHEHAGPHHSSLIHRHFLTHSVFGGISLSHTDDDPPRVLDSVGVTTSAAPALKPVAVRYNAITIEPDRQAHAPRENPSPSIHAPPNLRFVALRAPPFSS